MSAGSLKDLVKTLGATFSLPYAPFPLPEDVPSSIQAYLDKHLDVDEHESQRLHEELLALHSSKVQGNPEMLAAFLTCFRSLMPAIPGIEELSKWWEVLVKPTFDSMGQAKAVVADARAIVLSVLAYDEDDDPTGKKAQASLVFTDKLFGIFLEKTKLSASSDRSTGMREEQKQRFVSANVEAVLLAYGKRRPKAFLEKIDSFIVQKEFRLQVLGLLCSYVRLQGPHLYQVLQTPLLDHLLQCLENDTSTTVIALALTVLIMFMPHLCNSLGAYLPRLFVVYTRVLCWDKFGVVRVEENRFTTMDTYSRTGTPLSIEYREESINGDGWQKLNSSFETATSTTPDVGDYFSFLYGLYPINFMSFIRDPYKFLERVEYKDIDQLEIEEETIRQRTELYRQSHTIHPNFLILTAETELSDQSRWMKVEPADVTAQCIGLVNNNISAEDMRRIQSARRSTIPEALVPTEDIPTESLLSQGDEYAAGSGDNDIVWPPSSANIGSVMGLFHERRQTTGSIRTGPPSRDPRTSSSPLPVVDAETEGDAHLQDMLKLQEQLQASFQDMKQADENTPSPKEIPPQLSGPPSGYPSSAGASPRLDAYVHSLSHNTIPRSPALRPAHSDSQATIAYLQREVMLLKNDLNFERYLKQQHLSHIGHLQRKHIKESTAEAETQNLINTNKSLKAKLEEAKKAYAASRQEALKSKNQAKKWEAELSAKIRTLREEQKVWRHDEESTKQALQVAREEVDHMRKLLVDSEADGLKARQGLESLNANIEEVNKLKSFVDHLSNKLTEYDARAQEFETQRHNEETALQQVERVKLRLASRDQELESTRQAYEEKVQGMESQLSSVSNPVSPSPSPSFQGMIDSALSLSNSRLASLNNIHSQLLQKYTDLEAKYIELQAAREMDAMRHSSPRVHSPPVQSSYIDGQSDAEGGNLQQPNAHNIRRQYQHSEDSLSPHSSFTDSSNGHHSGMRDYISQTSSSMGPLSPGLASHPAGGSMSLDSMQHHPEHFDRDQPHNQLKHRPSMPNSVAATMLDDTRIVRTVKSATSSDKQRRDRAHGKGIHGIGKKSKDKDDGEPKDPKPKKRPRFPTGSGLAHIRGFV